MNFLRKFWGSSKIDVSDIFCLAIFNIDLDYDFVYDFVKQQFRLGSVGLFSNHDLAHLCCDRLLII